MKQFVSHSVSLFISSITPCTKTGLQPIVYSQLLIEYESYTSFKDQLKSLIVCCLTICFSTALCIQTLLDMFVCHYWQRSFIASVNHLDLFFFLSHPLFYVSFVVSFSPQPNALWDLLGRKPVNISEHNQSSNYNSLFIKWVNQTIIHTAKVSNMYFWNCNQNMYNTP